MNNNLARLITALIMLLTQTAAIADMENGRTLTERNCTGCHDDSMYTREDPRVTTLGALQKQVRRCETNLGLTWFDEETNDVINYLNTQYYHFK